MSKVSSRFASFTSNMRLSLDNLETKGSAETTITEPKPKAINNYQSQPPAKHTFINILSQFQLENNKNKTVYLSLLFSLKKHVKSSLTSSTK